MSHSGKQGTDTMRTKAFVCVRFLLRLSNHLTGTY